jgi:hypothetical protein
MRKRPVKELKEQKFIESAALNSISESKARLKWPLLEFLYTPEMEEGSSLNKPITLPLKEFEWKTLDAHVKKLGVGKSEWIRHAIYKLLIDEQRFLNGLDKFSKSL